MKFIRELISEHIARVAHEVLPLAVGDAWQSSRFTVLFPGEGIVLQSIQKDSEQIEWDTVAGFSGECMVRIHSDVHSPIDPTPLAAHLAVNPLIIKPSENTLEIPDKGLALQFGFKATGFSDLISDGDLGVITCIFGEITDGYLLQRSPYNTFRAADVQLTINKNINPDFLR